MSTPKKPTGEGNAGPERVPAELLDVNQIATMIGVSGRTVYRLADHKKMPRPLKIGVLNRWRAQEVRDWIDDGCPPMSHKRKRGGK